MVSCATLPLKGRATMASEAYRSMARECYELARKTEDDVRRRELILLAGKWTELAELNEKRDDSKLSLTAATRLMCGHRRRCTLRGSDDDLPVQSWLHSAVKPAAKLAPIASRQDDARHTNRVGSSTTFRIIAVFASDRSGTTWFCCWWQYGARAPACLAWIPE
jgi:hypothetical protein